jgi:hypothetical protein
MLTKMAASSSGGSKRAMPYSNDQSTVLKDPVHHQKC